MKLIHVGRDYYWKSGTFLSSLYDEEGRRSDWGKVEIALEEGEPVEIRPATKEEIRIMDSVLAGHATTSELAKKK